MLMQLQTGTHPLTRLLIMSHRHLNIDMLVFCESICAPNCGVILQFLQDELPILL